MVEVVVIDGVLVSPSVILEKKQKGVFIFAFVLFCFLMEERERDNTSLFPLIHNL